MNKTPWVSALNKLRKIQGINANKANDPWAQEFRPLLASLFKDKVLSVENESDASLIVEYVKQIGMLNTPKTCRLFIECQRAKSFEDLQPTTVALLEKFGINLRRPDGTWRFPSPRSIVNELEKAVRVFNSALLDDRIPDGLITELGREQFSKLIGRTRWDREDNVDGLVRKWQKTVARHPELAIIPNGFEPSSFVVDLYASRQEGAVMKEADDVVENRIEKEAVLLKSKEALDGFMPLASAIQIGLRNFSHPIEWWGERKAQSVAVLEKQISELQNWLAMSAQAMDDLVMAEIDPEKKSVLIKKQKAITNEKGRQGMVKQAVDTERIKSVVATLEIGEGDDAALVGMLTVLAPFSKSSSEIAGILSELSALHMIKAATEEWRAQLKEQFLEDIAPSAKRIEFLADFARQYIFEHYLNKDQVLEHIGHTPFDSDLRKVLERIWQQQLDKKGLLPIEQLSLKFKIEDGEAWHQTNKDATVHMLPMTGLLRIYSGDIGDACYTSQHHQLAMGDFPRVRAWIYASGSEKKLCGSLLGVETARDDGVPVLVARANNPQENFIRSVSADQFVVNSLFEVINTARRIRDARIKTSSSISEELKRQCMAIPLDRATQSSTNRGPVAEVYYKRFNNLAKIGLKNEPETNFNIYAVWNKKGSHACATIWEIDENGKETWYGDWNLEKENK